MRNLADSTEILGYFTLLLVAALKAGRTASRSKARKYKNLLTPTFFSHTIAADFPGAGIYIFNTIQCQVSAKVDFYLLSFLSGTPAE